MPRKKSIQKLENMRKKLKRRREAPGEAIKGREPREAQLERPGDAEKRREAPLAQQYDAPQPSGAPGCLFGHEAPMGFRTQVAAQVADK